MRHFQEGIGIEAELFGKHQPLGERQPVQPENEIDRQFGAAAIADVADMKAAREQRIENVGKLLRNGRIASDQRNPVAVPHLFAGAGDRDVEKADATLADPRRKCTDAVGIGRGACR